MGNRRFWKVTSNQHSRRRDETLLTTRDDNDEVTHEKHTTHYNSIHLNLIRRPQLCVMAHVSLMSRMYIWDHSVLYKNGGPPNGPPGNKTNSKCNAELLRFGCSASRRVMLQCRLFADGLPWRGNVTDGQPGQTKAVSYLIRRGRPTRQYFKETPSASQFTVIQHFVFDRFTYCTTVLIWISPRQNAFTPAGPWSRAPVFCGSVCLDDTSISAQC